MSVTIFNNVKYEYVMKGSSRPKSSTSAGLLTSSKHAISHLENVLFLTFHEIYYYVDQH